MILIYKDKATLDDVWNEMPFIGLCHLRGDFPRSADGTPIRAELTETPIVRPARSSDGRYAQSYPWDEDAMAEFEAHWSALFSSGALAWWEAMPADWKPYGWQEAPADGLEDGWKAVAMDADR